MDAAHKISASQSLRLSRYADANDDHELATRWCNLYCEDENGPLDFAINVGRKLDGLLRHARAFASFSHDGKDWHSTSAPTPDDTDGGQHPSMRTHYSDGIIRAPTQHVS